MRIAVPAEVKDQEYRVAVTPAGAHELVRAGHEVYVQAGAGAASALSDGEYIAAGAHIVPTADDVWATADLVVKVKEPVAEEYGRLRRGQVLFTYLHLAASAACTDALLRSGITSIAYETVERPDGSLPLLAPMSEIAGRLATVVGAYHLMRQTGGRGVLLGGVPGVHAAKVVVLGAGMAGSSALEMALGLHGRVSVLDRNLNRLRQIDDLYRGRCQTLASNAHQIEELVVDADLVIGAVLVPGAKAPKLVTDALVAQARPGSVFVDISIDQGGCFEGSKPTTHAEPTFRVHDSLFYCVANMPGSVPRTSTFALSNATLPYVIEIAANGWQQACRDDASLAAGLTTHDGVLTSEPVGEAHGYDTTPVATVLSA